MAALPEKRSRLNAVSLLLEDTYHQKTKSQMLSTDESLPEEVRRILYRYDCDCEPSIENQLGTKEAYENLVDLWGVKSSQSSPDSQPPSVSVSVPTTPAVDPSTTVTPTPSPSLFDDFNVKLGFNKKFKKMHKVLFKQKPQETNCSWYVDIIPTLLLGISSGVS